MPSRKHQRMVVLLTEHPRLLIELARSCPGIDMRDDLELLPGPETVRFPTTERIAAWYRDPARGPDVRIASTAARGEATVISGMRDEDRFELRIAPGPDGGGQARLVLTDRDR